MRVRLLVVQGRPAGKALQFPRGDFVFGRGLECHVRPNSDWVSRQHCLLRVTDDSVYLRDLDSLNGTLVNGARLLGERRLAQGDRVQLGPLVFRIELDDQPCPVDPPHLDPLELPTTCLETRDMPALGRDANQPSGGL